MRLSVLALLLALPASALANGGISKVNGAIRTDPGQVYGDLSTVNGSIELRARVRAASVSTVNGGIRSEAAASARDLTTVNGGIRLGNGNLVTGDVTTVNGSIRIADHGRVDGNVITVNGGISLDQSRIGGMLRTSNGDITVGAGSVVVGGIRVDKPQSHWWWPIRFESPRPPIRVVIGPGAVVQGPLQFQRPVLLYVSDRARIGNVSGATPVRFSGEAPPAAH